MRGRLRSSVAMGCAVLLGCAALPGLGGCTAWPDEGTGGLAERRPSADPVLAEMEARLDGVIARGARSKAAALTDEAEVQLIRARRSFEAGFVVDSARDAARLDRLLAAIESRVGAGSVLSRKG